MNQRRRRYFSTGRKRDFPVWVERVGQPYGHYASKGYFKEPGHFCIMLHSSYGFKRITRKEAERLLRP